MTELWLINEFHIQILAFGLLFCWKFERRRGFWLRLIPLSIPYLILPTLVEGSYFAPFLCFGWFTFSFIIMLLLCGGLLWFCFRMTPRQLILTCCVAHTLQHLTHCISRSTVLLGHLDTVPANAAELVITIAVLLLSGFTLRRYLANESEASMKPAELVIFAVLSSAIVYCISLWCISGEGESLGQYLFDICCCVLLLVILLDTFRLRKSEREQLLLLRLLRQEQEQHELNRATVDVINRKCHDLRHQISALRHMGSEEQERSIGALEEAVLIYDSFPKSGNENVDLILAEKSLLAEQQQISIRSIVDGKGLSFLSIEDLYSLLGNALDNAIEAAGKEEPSRRIITLCAAPKRNLFSIHLENPCSEKPKFSEGLPVTTKPDTDYHGYGVRSMRFLCEKYNGVLITSWEDGIFLLDILLPMPTQPTSS